MIRTLALFLALAASSQAATLMRVALGTGGTDAAGNVWASGSAYCTSPAVWTSANQASMASLPIPYNSLRYSTPAGATITCTFPVPAGAYNVVLKLVEPNKTAAGQRVFSVATNDSRATDAMTVQAANVDIFAVAGGAMLPYSVTLSTSTTAASGGLKITFAPNSPAMNAVCSGVQIDDATPPPPPSGGATYAPGPGIQFDTDGITGVTVVRLDPGYQGVGFKPWISTVFPGPDASVTIRGTDHGIHYLPNCPIAVQVWEAADPVLLKRIEADVTVHRDTCDVDVKFAVPQAKYLIVVR